MSYARMEGFLDGVTGLVRETDEPAGSWSTCLEDRLVERWISCAFFGTLIVILLVGFLRG